jgi:LysM repeat protein
VLSADAKQSVADISAAAEQRMQHYLDSMRAAGKDPNPAELARLRQQTRTELAGVLSPQQLEEYLLRYSQTANNLRSEFGKLKYFNATPDEFRAIFRATDSIDQQIELLGSGTDPVTVAQRNALLQQRDGAVKLAIGADRYRQYVELHDPIYQQAMAQAIQNGDPNSADAIYAIDVVAQNQQNQISNANLTDSQKAIEMKQLELDQLKAATAAAGQPLPPEPPPAPPPTPTQTHIMGKTETVAALANLYGISMSAMQAANPNVDLNNVLPGEPIHIPTAPLQPLHLVVPPASQ